MNRRDFQKLADTFIEEAEVLLKAKKYGGAYYLAGYAVECAFKACIAKRTRKNDYPDKDLANRCYTHDLEKLMDIAGFKTLLPAAGAALQANWAVVKDWDEQSRYERKTRVEAQGLFGAITDPTHGVLPWIKSR